MDTILIPKWKFSNCTAIYRIIGYLFVSIAGLLCFVSCNQREKIQQADIILYNGKVISVDSAFGIYSGVAIKGSKILRVGSDKEVLSLKGSDTRVINLKEHAVIPGLIDNHAHPVPASKSEMDNPLPDLKTISDLVDWISREAARKPDGEWIVHPKFFFSRLQERRWPTKAELDQVAPDNPVFLNGSYAGMVNTNGIEVSGLVQKNHPGVLTDPETKIPSGIIRRSAFSLLSLDDPEELTREKKLELLKKLFQRYNSIGITSITAGSGRTEDLELMKALYESGNLTVRVFQNILVPFEADMTVDRMKDELAELGYHTGDGNEWVRIGALKARMDGGILTGTAYMRTPWGGRAGEIYGFSEPDYRGELYLTTFEIANMATAAYDMGWKFTAHVTGGGGVDTLLSAYEIVNKSRPVSGKRFSIIHGNFFNPQAVQKMKSMTIYADMQPMWLYKDVDLLIKALPQEMLENFHPYQSLLEAGIVINGGSDHMVISDPDNSINPYNPFLSIYTLVSRKSENGTVFLSREIISRQEALMMYTINNAFSSFEETIKGSIEPGKLADIVVLSDDILVCKIGEIPKIRSLLTMVGGEIVHDTEELR